MADDQSKSRRAIDLYSAEQFARMDEKLRVIQKDVQNLDEEVFGSHGAAGLGEQVRGIIKTWGAIIAIGTTALSWIPWVYDHFISKGINRPIFGEEVREKWIKESTRRIRIYNKDTKQWQYYYALEESKPEDDQQ